jgi:ABC-type glycerol-3-phosphate transport system permease component
MPRKSPREIDEPAWVDSASFPRAFLQGFLPLTLPGLFSVGVFVLSWNEFLFASGLMTESDSKTTPVGIAEFITECLPRCSAIFCAASCRARSRVSLPRNGLDLSCTSRAQTAVGHQR